MSDRILILGASTRAAAQSAARAGLRLVCADLFADEDLRAVAEVLPVSGYPRGLVAAARVAPACPWMYTGALENHPAIVRAISRERPLLGNPAGVLRRVRDPVLVQGALQQAGLPGAAVRPASDPPDPDGRWLLKPRRGAAGRGIVVWDSTTRDSKTLREPHYFQERLSGTPISALFVAFPEQTLLIGIAEHVAAKSKWELVLGKEALDQSPITSHQSPMPFRYCGSLGPIRLSPTAEDQIERTGRVLAAAFGLRGLFGCDFIDEGNQVRLTEVNPRYTASVEVYEHAWQQSVLAQHIEAFLGSTLRSSHSALRHDQIPRAIVGKLVLYAEQTVRVPSLAHFNRTELGSGVPGLADIPAPGTLIEAGHPICSVLAAADGPTSCRELLQCRARALRAAFYS